jgi:hypothetical protein
MKKKVLLSGLFALALLATAGYGMNQKVKSNANLSDLALANVEALANNESTPGIITCYSTLRVEPNDPNIYEPIWSITNCNGCVSVGCFEYRDSGTCNSGGFILI